jgi:uncharacterized protein (TIGR03032 family)
MTTLLPDADSDSSRNPSRSVDFEYSDNFPRILAHFGVTLLITTYQAGKLVVVGMAGGKLDLRLYNFERAMGLAVSPDRLAVGAQNQVWLLRNSPEIAPQIAPVGQHKACYLTRSCWFTGEIQAHEMAFAGDELWVANTLFSCLSTLDDRHSFVPRWRPRFISQLAAEDRCHLNGMAMADGRPVYVTALAETDSAAGWRPIKVTSGVVIDVSSSEVVARGLCMPHSPRVHEGQLFALDSGTGRLIAIERASGRIDAVGSVNGYARGLVLVDRVAFVGLSKIRETSTFGGLPISEQPAPLQCGVAVVELQSGKTVAWLHFRGGVEEVFDVGLLPNAANVAVSGPYPQADGTPTIWLAGAGRGST